MKELLKYLTETNFVLDKEKEIAKKARLIKKENINIKVIGIGGCGCNVIDILHNQGFKHAELIIFTSDLGHLNNTYADKKFQTGKNTCNGLGCGGNPKLGLNAIKEVLDFVKCSLLGADLVIICTGLGGGAGTGGAPIIAKIAKEIGALVIGVMTMPLKIEKKRIQKAKLGLKKLTKVTNTIILLDNNKIFHYNAKLKVQNAFKIMNNILSMIIKNIVDSANSYNLANLSFEDLKIVFGDGKFATVSIDLINTKEQIALNNFTLYNIEPKAIKTNWSAISGDSNMTLDEMVSIAKKITSSLSDDSKMFWTASMDDKLKGRIFLMNYLTGIENIKLLDKQVTWFDETKPKEIITKIVKDESKILDRFNDETIVDENGEINIKDYSKEELNIIEILKRRGEIYMPRLNHIKRLE